MQIIQSIRDKGAAITIIVIALALIAFILMDARSGSNNMAGSRSSSIGKVNGRSIGIDEFNRREEEQELVQMQQAQQQGRSGELSTSEKNDIKAQLWNQLITENVFYNEADKLGIDFTTKEFNSLLSSKDQNNPILREITDEKTGEIDEAKKGQIIDYIKKAKGQDKARVEAQIQIDRLRLTSVSTKYYALLTASAYYPTWMEEADKKETREFANVSYTAIPYNVISDSTIKVSDEEIAKYVQAHKESFKQEEGRSISYISFSQLPDAADSARTKEAITVVKPEFETTDNLKAFVARNSAGIAYDTTFKPRSQIRVQHVDSIVKMPINAVYGPFVDGQNYMLAKVTGTKMMPDSVTARHILIGTMDPQTQQPLLEDSVAKKRADSILNAINNGADFAALVKQYSTDQGSKDKGGEYKNIPYGQMVPEFNEYIFTRPVGSRGVVKTQFGYHIINITGQKGSSPAYRIAFVAKEIIASETTITNANLEASKAAAEKTAKKLDEYTKKHALQKVDAGIIKESDFRLGNLQDARQIVNWAYKADQGDVSEAFTIGNQFVVAVLNKIYKKGTQDVETARPLAENSIREEKKAAAIMAKVGATPTLESAAAAYNQQVMIAGADSSLTFSGITVNGIGNEPKLIGAAFNKEYQTKVSPAFAGKTAVYVIKVNSIGTKPDANPEAAATLRTQKLSSMRATATTRWFEGLKDLADIKDNTKDFF